MAGKNLAAQRERLKKRQQQAAIRAEESITTYRRSDIASEPPADASPEVWAEYINDAQGRAVEALLEWGRRIGLAHEAYALQPQRWGRTWEDWCRERLGISRATADRLKAIAANLAHNVSDILPSDQQALYFLARLRRDAPTSFEEAVQEARIHPGLTRQEAQALLLHAQLPSRVPLRPPAFRRVANCSLEVPLAEKLEAIARSQGKTPARLRDEILTDWLRRQPLPSELTTIEVPSAEN